MAVVNKILDLVPPDTNSSDSLASVDTSKRRITSEVEGNPEGDLFDGALTHLSETSFASLNLEHPQTGDVGGKRTILDQRSFLDHATFEERGNAQTAAVAKVSDDVAKMVSIEVGRMQIMPTVACPLLDSVGIVNNEVRMEWELRKKLLGNDLFLLTEKIALSEKLLEVYQNMPVFDKGIGDIINLKKGDSGNRDKAFDFPVDTYFAHIPEEVLSKVNPKLFLRQIPEAPLDDQLLQQQERTKYFKDRLSKEGKDRLSLDLESTLKEYESVLVVLKGKFDDLARVYKRCGVDIYQPAQMLDPGNMEVFKSFLLRVREDYEEYQDVCKKAISSNATRSGGAWSKLRGFFERGPKKT